MTQVDGIDPTVAGALRSRDAQDLRAEAFRRLLRDGRVCVRDACAGMEPARAARAVEVLVGGGRMVVQDGHVVGVAGLSLSPTRHRMSLGPRWWYTWCAYDAVGIPAALSVDTEVNTDCFRCRRPITISIAGGRPPEASTVVGWLPEPASPTIRQFCPLANLFCSAEHRAEWLDGTDGTRGEACSLEHLAERGRADWGPLLRR